MLRQQGRKRSPTSAALRPRPRGKNGAAQLAQKNYTLALGTLETVIFNIQRKLEGVPAAHEVRRGLLATAMSGLQDLANGDAEHDAVVDRDSAAALVAIGDLLLRVGDEGGLHGTQKAEEAFRRAFAIANRLSSAEPDDAEAARDLSISCERLGDATLQTGDAGGARKYYEQVLKILLRLSSDNPKSSEAAHDLSRSYERLGNVTLQMGDAAGAEILPTEYGNRSPPLRCQP